MPGTQVKQTRSPVTAGALTTYEIAAVCTLQGTLPDANIFLMKVVQPDDPKNDTFQHVCEVTDFTNYGTSRESSISSATFLYRIQTFSKSYPDIVTANDAWKELQDRINKLVVDYNAFITEFLTSSSGIVTTFPTLDEGAKAALIAEYGVAQTAVTTAEDARDTESVMCEAKRASLRSLQERLVEAQADLAVLNPIVGALGALMPSYATLSPLLSSGIGTIQIVSTASSASAGDKAQIDAQLALMRGQVASLDTSNSSLTGNVQIPLGTLQATIQSRVTSLTSEVNALVQEVNACALEMADLQGAVDAARARANQILADIRAVCPDFIPS
jgi:hypothetical protein